MRAFRYTHLAAFLLLIAAYVGLRFWRLTDSCLWFDEIFSVHAAEHPWGELFSFVALDLIHPPLFYVLLKLWISLGGEGLFWLRTLPVLFSVLAIFPFIAFLREVKCNRNVEWLSLVFIAINGSLLKYSQEVRMYSLLLCLSLFSIWLFARYFIKGKSFMPLVIVNIFLVYTHYFGWFVVVSEVAAILYFQRIKWSRTLTMFGIVLVCFAPWAIATLRAAGSGSSLGQNIGWIAKPGIHEIGIFLLDLIEPFYSQASTAEPTSIHSVSIPLVLILLTILILYFVDWRSREDDEKRAAQLLTIFVLGPLVLAFAASWLMSYSVWGTRHLIIVFPPFAILLAVATSSVSFKLKPAAITLVLLFTGYAFFLQWSRPAPQYSWCAWASQARYASANAASTIYVFEDLVAYHVWYMLRSNGEDVVRVSGIDGLTEDKAYFLPRGFEGVRTSDITEVNGNDLWIAFRAKNVTPRESPLRNFLVKGYRIANRQVIAADGERAILVRLQK